MVSKFLLRFNLGVVLALICGASLANPLLEGDKYFSNQQYKKALEAYMQAAEQDQAKAFYQLGVMHYKGLGTSEQSFNALIWFSMAAEKGYDNASEIVDNLIASAAPEEKERIAELIKSSQLSFSKQLSYRQYQPKVKSKALDKKIMFDDLANLNDVEFATDLGIDESGTYGLVQDGGDFYEELSDFDGGAVAGDFIVDTPYFLIVDYDIAPDGSIRNAVPVKHSGEIDSALFTLSLNTLPKPHLENDGVFFINRSYLGMARYNKYRMRKEYPIVFRNLRNSIQRLKDSERPKEQYAYAMALQNFPWLSGEESDIDKYLLMAASNGFRAAQYEYGLNLYRQQRQIEDAIYWLSEAAKQEHPEAMYRIGRILTDSPWVEVNEKNALFWFNSAADKGHIVAKQKAALLKLLANDESLIDVDGARAYLADIEERQGDNPEYLYLQAMAHLKMQPRQLDKTVSYLRQAIKSGNGLNWDVSDWLKELNSWTTGGGVTISDIE